MARRAAIRALELDPNLADAHTSLAEVFKDYDWNWALAERHFRHAKKKETRTRASAARRSTSSLEVYEQERRNTSEQRRETGTIIKWFPE